MSLSGTDRRGTTRPRPPRPAYVRFERFVLGIGMGIMAFVIERRLLRALKRGEVTSAPRTAAGHGPDEEMDGSPAGSWEVSSHGSGLTAGPREGG